MIKSYLITKEEFDQKGFDQITNDAEMLVSFKAEEQDVYNLTPNANSIIEGIRTSQGTEIRLPHKAL